MWPSNICIGLKYPCDYGTDNYNPLCPDINGETPSASEGLFSSPASWIVHKSPSYSTDALLLIQVQSQSSFIIAMIVSWEQSEIYGFLLSAQGTSCSKPRRSHWSSPLRSDGSQDDQAGEAGPVEQSSAEAKGLSGCCSSEQQPRQPDRGKLGQIKGLLSQHIYKKKRELKAALHWSTTREKGSSPKKKHHGWKERTLTLGSRSCCCRW